MERTDLAGRNLLVLTPFPDQILGGAFKRAVDLVGSVAGMLLLSPILLTVALLVKFTSPGPAFYAQTRLGRNGRPFKFYKFRTMVNGADAMKNGLMAQNEMAWTGLQDQERPAHHLDRSILAALQHRRATTALERVYRRDESGRPASARAGKKWRATRRGSAAA